MNRAIRHDLLMLRRETTVALARWTDRVVVLMGIALICVAARQAAADAPARMVEGLGLLMAGSVGFAWGRLVEQRLAFHRECYLFAADVLPRHGSWRFRLSGLAAASVLAVATAVAIDGQAVFPALTGTVVAYLLALGTRIAPSRTIGTDQSVNTLLAPGVGTAGLLAVAAVGLWPRLPGWAAALPIAAVVATMSRGDADVARFEARIGQSTTATLGQLRPAVLWALGAVLVAALAAGPQSAAIGAASGVGLLWYAALRLLTWRMTSRRSGDLAVLALVAVSGVVGAMAIVLAPIALAAGSVWLWRRSQAAAWLIA